VAISPPKYNSQGFTLIEMLVTVMIGGVVFGFAAPSFLSWNKPLRDGSLQFKSHLNLIRSKAISSNNSYRLRPKYFTQAEYITNDNPEGIPRNFVVEYATNCKMTTGWIPASQFDLDLPASIGIPITPTQLPTETITNSLEWNNGKGLCFDNRGIVDDTTSRIVLRDFRGDSKAKIALLDITKVGNVDIVTYSEKSNIFTRILPNSQGNPEF
jgi:prepilin-type N-terminal cleavage/methylation domain-containing protein